MDQSATARWRRRAGPSGALLIAFWSPCAWAETASEATAESKAATLESKKACIELHEQAQILRRTGKLLEARQALLICSQETCPPAVQVDCADWRDQVSSSVPSVVIKAKVGNNDDFSVRVSIDGQAASSALDGTPISLNPGPHAFRFERLPFEPIDQDVLLVEGEQRRVLSVTFGAPVPEPSPVPGSEIGSVRADEYRPVPPLAFVLGGVALLGAGGFTGFGLWGKSQQRSLESSCQPVCTDAEVRPVRTKFILADASLATAIVATTVGAFVYIGRPSQRRASPEPEPAASGSAPRMAVLLTPSSSGAAWSLRGEF
jgi:hypothetical protein